MDGITLNNLKMQIQIEKGSQATEYEQYLGGQPSPNPDYPQDVHVVTGENSVVVTNSDNTLSKTYPINLGYMELCKIGDYQDYIYNSGNKWYKHKAIGKAVLDGMENWQLSNQTNRVFYIKDVITDFSRSDNVPYSNYYQGTTNTANASTASSRGNNSITLTTASNNYLYIVDNRFTSATDFVTWLQSNNVTLYYILAEATEEEITDTTLISQLNAIKQMKTYEGITYITLTGEDLAPTAEVDYYKSTPAIIEDLVRRIEILESEV